MPRIPFSLASGEVASHIPAGNPSPGIWAAPGVAVQHFGAEMEQTSEKLVEAERRVQSTRDRVFASQLLSALDLHMEDLREKTGTGVSGAVAEKGFVDAAQAFVNDHLAGTTDERLRQAIQAEATQRIGHGAIVTRRYVNARIIEQTQGQALEQIRELAKLGTPESLKEGTDLIRGLTSAGVFSAEAGNAQAETIRRESITNAFARDIRASLTDTFDSVNQRRGIYATATDVEQERLIGAVRTELDRQEIKARQALRDEQEIEKQRAAQIKAESDDAHREATRLAMNGTYTIDRLDQESRAYRWTATEYQHLRELVVNPKTKTSDPDTLQNAMLRSRSVNVTQRDRDDFAASYRNGKLSAEDYARVDNEAQTNLGRIKDEKKSALGHRHAQAEENLRLGLGIVGILEAIDPISKKALSGAMDELTRRSAYMDGTEDPIAVQQEILPRYQSILTQNATLNAAQKTSTLRYKTPAELEAAKGKISPESYRIEKQRLLDIGAYLPPMLRANMYPETMTPQTPGLKREAK